MEQTPAEIRELLQAAGYRWEAESEAWINDETHRELNGHISCLMPTAQLKAWVKAGEGRERF